MRAMFLAVGISLLVTSAFAAPAVKAMPTGRKPAQFVSYEACSKAYAKAEQSGKTQDADDATYLCQNATASACARKHEVVTSDDAYVRALCNSKAALSALQSVGN
ncbi:MAG: hypothetical protein EOP06_04120 [Proteobacteria bacterium]|nr:MAG: hypothetical protein EOP06_04120 [Pseudomonadota bacterium]